MTFIRAPPGTLLKVDIPLVFIGDDVSPGLKKGNKRLRLYLLKKCSSFCFSFSTRDKGFLILNVWGIKLFSDHVCGY